METEFECQFIFVFKCDSVLHLPEFTILYFTKLYLVKFKISVFLSKIVKNVNYLSKLRIFAIFFRFSGLTPRISNCLSIFLYFCHAFIYTRHSVIADYYGDNTFYDRNRATN